MYYSNFAKNVKVNYINVVILISRFLILMNFIEEYFTIMFIKINRLKYLLIN